MNLSTSKSETVFILRGLIWFYYYYFADFLIFRYNNSSKTLGCMTFYT